jgi:hypothetical protein
MDSTLWWGYVFVFGVLPVLGIAAALATWLWSRDQRERSRELAAFAVARGLRYRRHGDRAHPLRYADFEPLGRPRGWAAHVIDGRGGEIEWDLFDFTYGSRQSFRERDRWGVVAARVPGLTLPRARIRPETVLHKLLDVVGLHDIQTGSRAFDHRFRVSGADDESVRRLLGADVTACLMAHPSDHDWRMRGDTIVILHHTTFMPDELPAVMDAVEEFARCVRARAAAAADTAAEPPKPAAAAPAVADAPATDAPVAIAIGPLSS